MKNPIEIIQREPSHKDSSGGGTNLEDVKAWERKSFYERLGISTTATKEEIVQAFKKLSRKYHPDKITGNDVLKKNYEQIQTLLGEAKSVLTNESDRQKYDMQTHFANPGSRTQSRGASSGFSYEDFFTKHSQGQHHQQQPKQERKQEPKKESKPFNEEEALKDFVQFFKKNIEDSIYGFPNIGMMVLDLLNKGVKKEKIVKTIESTAIEHFTKYTKDQLKDNLLGINKIQGRLRDLTSIGIEKTKLINAIEKNSIEHFANYTKDQLKDTLLGTSKIRELQNGLISVGIEKNKLINAIEKNSIDYFEQFTKNQVKDKLSGISKVKNLMRDLIQIGIDSNKLSRIIQIYNIN